MDANAQLKDECWAIALVEVLQQQVTAGRTILYALRTGVKIYGEPPGLAARGEISDVRVIRRAAPAPDSVRSEVELTFHNTGTLHTVAHGSVEIRRPDNSLAGKVEVPELYTLPGAERRVVVRLPALSAGRYVALAFVDYGGDEIAAAQLDYEAK